jgi:hypothetical protein
MADEALFVYFEAGTGVFLVSSNHSRLLDAHPWGCPVYVLKSEAAAGEEAATGIVGIVPDADDVAAMEEPTRRATRGRPKHDV